MDADTNIHLNLTAQDAMRPICFNTGCKGDQFIRLRDELERRDRVAREAWGDQEDEHSAAISAAHPANSRDERAFATFDTALAMIGKRHGTYELVALVNWLLLRAESAEGLLREAATLFRFYEQSHLAKKTQDGDEKAHRNAEIAGRIEAALAHQSPGEGTSR